ncbi:peptidase inhibitor family I36 protein [Microbacterium hominis]|uniref:peptidase inhibitor family I36 protein n=1 Tax=Microbacterium hominis TaxID=162426 RepID=UPI00068987A6|nr:peptidase inhibitor family I36 protein [Microbacterium hominis]
MRKLISRAGLGALFTTLVLLFAPVAAAQAHGLAGPGPQEHCAVQIHPIDEQLADTNLVCFGSEAEVAQYVQGRGGVARGAAASLIVGTVYKDHNGGGASLTFWGSTGCAGETFGFPTLASGWDNSISSARGSNGCWLTLYTTTGYGGSRLNCTPYCASIGSWNDNVKSLVFRPTGTFG